MSISFSYRLVALWQDMRFDPAKALVAGLRPHQRLLLASGGSLTLDIEYLLETEIKVELMCRQDCLLSAEAASYLQAAQGAQACERVVWLKAGKMRLVYAHTVFLLESTDPSILEYLDRCPDEPLGKILNLRHINFTKSRMEVGVVSCGQAASVLGMAQDTLFIARRYVLADAGPSTAQAGRVKAVVTEVFSPEIIPITAVRPQASD